MRGAEMRPQDALSALLKALGFEQMAADVTTEEDDERIQRYARVIVKNTPVPHRQDVRDKLTILRVL